MKLLIGHKDFTEYFNEFEKFTAGFLIGGLGIDASPYGVAPGEGRAVGERWNYRDSSIVRRIFRLIAGRAKSHDFADSNAKIDHARNLIRDKAFQDAYKKHRFEPAGDFEQAYRVSHARKILEILINELRLDFDAVRFGAVAALTFARHERPKGNSAKQKVFEQYNSSKTTRAQMKVAEEEGIYRALKTRRQSWIGLPFGFFGYLALKGYKTALESDQYKSEMSLAERLADDPSVREKIAEKVGRSSMFREEIEVAVTNIVASERFRKLIPEREKPFPEEYFLTLAVLAIMGRISEDEVLADKET